MFAVVTQDVSAGDGLPRRVLVRDREGVMALTVPWRDGLSAAFQHRSAVLEFLVSQHPGDDRWTPHHIVGTAPMFDGRWVTLVQEGS